MVGQSDSGFAVVFCLMTQKSAELCTALLKKVHDLLYDFAATQVIADSEEAPTAPVHAVFGGNVLVS